MLASDNARGAALMSGSMAGFVINDSLIKSVSGELPLFEAISLRGVVASVLVLILALRAGALRFRPGRADIGPLALRTLGEVGGTICFLTALFNMPISNAVAILQVAPLAVALAASWFLGEPIGWRRYLAIAIGFCGVLLIVRPGGDGFNVFSVSALGAVAFITLRDIATRRMTRATPTLFASAVTAVSITAVGALGALAAEWVAPTIDHIVRLSVAACALLIAYVCGVMSMRVGEIGFVTPFRYSVLIWALALGWFAFGERPDALTLIGAGIVVGAGIVTLWRERISRRA